MNTTAIKLTALIALLSIGAIAQGPLTPPGAPAPTMKTLDQIEPRIAIQTLPFTINGPGSYYLARNLTGAEGITIAVSNVTLDLNGYVLSGAAGNSNSFPCASRIPLNCPTCGNNSTRY